MYEDILLHAHQAIEEILLMDLSAAVENCKGAQSIFYIGRGPFYPVALEGALKMKEISYIHAEGYAAGELKHGPFALLSPETPAIAICMPGETYRVMVSNIKEIKARGCRSSRLGAKEIRNCQISSTGLSPCQRHTPSSRCSRASWYSRFLHTGTAVALERDIDKPRNLAKSVTVE